MYKMHWFVFLALILKTPYDKFFDGSVNLEDLSIDDAPIDTINHHYEPWNEKNPLPCQATSVSKETPATRFYNASYDMTLYNEHDPNNVDHEIDELFNDFDELFDDENEFDYDDSGITALRDLINNYSEDEIYDEDIEVTRILDNALNLDFASYQEAISKVTVLAAACQAYLNYSYDCLDNHEENVREAYFNVHDYSSLIDFIETFTDMATVDERYQVHSLDVYFFPINSEAKLMDIRDYAVKDLDFYADCFDLTYNNGASLHIRPDKEFKIGAFSNGNDLRYEFFIIHNGAYFKLEFDFYVEQ